MPLSRGSIRKLGEDLGWFLDNCPLTPFPVYYRRKFTFEGAMERGRLVPLVVSRTKADVPSIMSRNNIRRRKLIYSVVSFLKSENLLQQTSHLPELENISTAKQDID